MTQLILQFEDNSVKNKLLRVIELMSGVTVVRPKSRTTKKSGIDKALADVEAGCVYKAKDVDDLFSQILD